MTPPWRGTARLGSESAVIAVLSFVTDNQFPRRLNLPRVWIGVCSVSVYSPLGDAPPAAGVASIATSASVSPSKGKSGESVGLHGSGAVVGVGETRAEAGGGTDEGCVKEWKTIEGDDEFEYEEDELKPRFLWRRRKRS